MPSPNRVFLFSPFLHPTLSFCLSMYMCTCIYCESRLQRSHPLPLRYCDELGLGKQTWRAQTKPCVHQEKGTVTPQETDSDFPMSVQPSWTEVWVSGGLLQGQGHLVQQCAQDLLKEVTIIFITSTIVWPQVKQYGGNTALPINRKLD